MPTVSVVVPVYKVERYLSFCVDSILEQTFKDFELILVDDGSPDNCGAICDGYVSKDNRVHVIHRENGGLSAARNSGVEWALKNSNSKWITFIDSDDWIESRYLESLLHTATSFKANVVIGTFVRKKEHKKITSSDIKTSEYPVEEYWMKDQTNATVAWGKLYKKSDFVEVRYPEGKIHEDQYTTYKILFRYEKVAVVETPILFYYFNADGITKSQWRVNRLDIFGAYKNQMKFFEQNGFDRAYKNTAWCYLDALCENMRAIKAVKEYESYFVMMKKELRKGIRKYKSTLRLSYKTSFRFYKYGYPMLAKIYRKLRMG